MEKNSQEKCKEVMLSAGLRRMEGMKEDGNGMGRKGALKGSTFT